MLIAICNAHTAREISRAVESENKLNKQKKNTNTIQKFFNTAPRSVKKGQIMQ